MTNKNEVCITLNIDRDLKEQVTRIYEDSGLTISTAIKMFLEQTVNDNELPFRSNAQKSEFNARNKKRTS